MISSEKLNLGSYKLLRVTCKVLSFNPDISIHQVTFKNEQTGEYQYYYVQFKATAPGVITTIELSTPVRQSTSRTITVHNPLLTPVNFQTNCNVQDVNLPPQFIVPPSSNVSSLVFYEKLFV